MTTKFKFDILENSPAGIVHIGEKEVYNLDGGEVSLMGYVDNLKKIELKSFPKLSSPLNVKESKFGKTLYEDAFAICTLHANKVEKNQSSVYIVNGGITENLGNIGVYKSNFSKAIAGFCARRLIQSNVWNDKDEYMKPSEVVLNSPAYQTWLNDCYVYSLFDNQSFQSSLRNVEYQGKDWDIINEFFWLSKDKMLEYATESGFIDMIDDIDEHGNERNMYKVLSGITLSSKAQTVIDMANTLIKDSMKYRQVMHLDKPDYHLASWDAGYAQLKIVWKEHMKEEFKAFRELVSELADYLRPNVYSFGFLYQ